MDQDLTVGKREKDSTSLKHKGFNDMKIIYVTKRENVKNVIWNFITLFRENFGGEEGGLCF